MKTVDEKITDVIHLHRPRQLGDSNIVASIEEITPQVATNWLRCNRLNRPVRRNHVSFLSREITEGLWQLNGQAIVVSDSEDILDGQHRLLAVIDSGQPIKSLVVYGVSREAFKTIDTGASRTGSDALSVWYPGRNVAMVRAVGGAVAWCVSLERGVIKQKDKIANAEVISYVAEHPSLWKCAEMLGGYPKEGRLLSLTIGTALYEMFSRKNRDMAAEFMLDLYGAEPIEVERPTFTLRSLLERDKRRVASGYPATIKVRMAIKTWNLIRANKHAVASPSMIAVNSKDSDRVIIR